MNAIQVPKTPKVDPVTSSLFWSYYMYRHMRGPECGPYGPKATEGFLKNLEKTILKEARPFGLAAPVPVPRIQWKDLPAADFKKYHLLNNTPVIIEGFASDWEAVKKWSPAYFKEHYPNEQIPVRLKGNAIDETSVKIATMSVADLVDNIYAKGSFFGANIEDIFNHNPELREELNIPRLTEYACEHKKSKIGSTQIFLSGGGARSGYHCTGGINLFVMVYGRKDWSFVPPQFSAGMYPVTRKDMFYAASPVEWHLSPEEIEKSPWPLYNYIPKYEARLKPGDVLFSPQWWWHAVDTPEPAIGVATRAMNRFIYGNKVFSWMWVTSPQFWKLVSHLVKTGWGSDSASGARLAFEQEFVNKSTH